MIRRERTLLALIWMVMRYEEMSRPLSDNWMSWCAGWVTTSAREGYEDRRDKAEKLSPLRRPWDKLLMLAWGRQQNKLQKRP